MAENIAKTSIHAQVLKKRGGFSFAMQERATK